MSTGAMELTPAAAAPTSDGDAVGVTGEGKQVRRASFGPTTDRDSAHVGNTRRGMKKVDSFVTEINQLKSVHGYRRADVMPWTVTLRLAFQTLGVVYGDLGTSPLYVYDSIFSDPPEEKQILGALSLIFYTILLVPLIKYIFIVLEANDRGNGGTFALYSLVCRVAGIKVATNQSPDDKALSSYSLLPKNVKNFDRAERIKERLRESKFLQLLLLTVALFGTCAVIGDGVLTPAISVLSAMSGIKTNFPNAVSQDVVTYSSAGILFLLFCLQRFGTDKVGFTFSPIILLWFISIFLIGCYNIHYHPAVFKAINPYYIYHYFKVAKKTGWISLGGIVLAITGTEAMFADLGHFSVSALQISFSLIVFPSIMFAYIGQAAYLVKFPEVIGATFYKSIPHGLFWPELIIATLAAIIASQAMITATFSIVEQSMALGCFPTCKLVYTSKKFLGQIYIPEINWILMVLTIVVTVGFRTGTQIGNAYGVAVVSVMLVTTSFLTLVILMVWQKSWWVALGFFAVFFSVEGIYYSSVLYKIPQGGWVPLAFVCVFFTIMYIWNYGRRHSYKYEEEHKVSLDWVLGLGSSLGMVRVPGVGLVYSELAQGVPSIFAHLTTNLPAMHSILVFVCVKHLPLPYVQEDERLLIRRVGPRQYHMYRVAVRYGYADVRDATEDFERGLMDKLANFIRMEGDHIELPAEEYLGGESKRMIQDTTIKVESNRVHDAATIDAAIEQNHHSGIDFAPELVPRSAYNVRTSLAQEVKEELALLEQSRQAAIVYMVGHTEVKASASSNFARKFIIDVAYNFMRRNTPGSTIALGIPPTRLVQIGMLRYI
ncbi:unnamed protein product [Calypogeia fissa]